MGDKTSYFAVLVLFLINLLFTVVIATGASGPVSWYLFIFILLFICAAAFFLGFLTQKPWTNLSAGIFFVIALINSIVFWISSRQVSGALMLVLNAAGLEITLIKVAWFRRMTASAPYFSKQDAIDKELPDIEEPEIIIDEDVEIESPVQFVGNTATGTFHVPTCRYAKQVKAGNKVFFDSRKEAVKSKYKACKCTEK